MPLGFLMDRYKTNIAVSQVSFIDTFVKPSFDSLVLLLPRIEENLMILSKNRENWENLKEYYDHQLKEIENRTTERDLIERNTFINIAK
jgi:hypothetical protein